jgi:ketosteroid isomerase-like protein
MTQEVAYHFIQALSALEEDGEVDPIVATFSESCEIGTPVIPEKLHGKAQARAYWTGYRTAYRIIHSTFRNIVIGETSVALEWTASGINRAGNPFQYDGVSILDTIGDSITHFRTYFDSRVIHEQVSRAASA